MRKREALHIVGVSMVVSQYEERTSPMFYHYAPPRYTLSGIQVIAHIDRHTFMFAATLFIIAMYQNQSRYHRHVGMDKGEVHVCSGEPST